MTPSELRDSQIKAAASADTLRKLKQKQAQSIASMMDVVPVQIPASVMALRRDRVDFNGSGKFETGDYQSFQNEGNVVNDWQESTAAPTGIAAAVTGTTVEITWQNNGTRVETLELFRDGQLVIAFPASVGPIPAGYRDTNVAAGSHSYTLRASNNEYQGVPSAAATATVQGTVPPPVEGWSNLDPVAGALTFYVATSGNDANPGTQAAPFRTISRGYQAMRDNQPDQLRLHRGDTFTMETQGWAKASGDPTKPMIVADWGTGARPKIRSNGTAFYGGSQNKRGLLFAHLDLAPNAPLDGSSAFCFFSPWSYVRFEGCYAAGYACNVVEQEVTTGVRSTGNSIHRCVFVDSNSPGAGHSQNAFVGNNDNWSMTECVMDKGGALENTLFSHSLYGSETNGPLKLIGNTFARSGSHGFQARSAGEMRFNLCLHNSINGFCGDSSGAPSTFTDNCAIDAKNCNPVDARGFGFVISGDVQALRNIVAHQRDGTDAIYGYSLDNIKSGAFSFNVCYDWGLPANNVGWCTGVQWESGGSGPVTFSHNIIAQKAGQRGVSVRNEGRGLVNVTYSNNRYFNANPFGGYGQMQSRVGQADDFGQWVATTHDTDSVFAVQPVIDVSVAAFLTEHGFSPGTDPLGVYMTEARRQEFTNYRPVFTAEFYIRWAQAKFGIASPTTPA